jgi:hypothetical protein
MVSIPSVDFLQTLHDRLKLAGTETNEILNIPENTLLYLVSVMRNEPADAPVLKQSDWEHLLKLLTTHWITPLVYWKIAHLPASCHPPAEVMGALRGSFHASNARRLQQLYLLKKALSALAEVNIPVLVAKGCALAHTVYPNPAARPFDDIDVFIRPGHFLKARAALQKTGFKPLTPRFELLQEVLFEEKFLYKGKDGELLLELHWYPHKSFGVKREIDIDELFKLSELVTADNVTFTALDRRDALLYAALHMVLHHTRDIRLSWIYDISMLAQQLTSEKEWKQLLERSAAWGAVIVLRRSLELAEVWTGFVIPEKIRDTLVWPEPSDGEKKTIQQVFRKRFRAYALFRQYISGAPTLGKKTGLIIRLVFPTPAYVRRSYANEDTIFLPVLYLRHYWHWFSVLMESLGIFLKT